MIITIRFSWHQGVISEDREVCIEQTGDEEAFSPMDVADMTAAVLIGMDKAELSSFDANADPKDEPSQ